MALTTFFSDPFFTDLDRAMNRILSSAVPLHGHGASAGAPRSPPAAGPVHTPMDIIETPTAYELHADAPGMGPEDVKVELHEGVLTVSGSRKVEHDSKDSQGKVWRSERSSYSFSRSVQLPPNADAEAVSASMDKGVLRVCLPKRQPEPRPEPRRIAVRSAL